MSEKEKLELIEKTISQVKQQYPIERLIIDCADKLSLSCDEVKNILIKFNSKLLKEGEFSR